MKWGIRSQTVELKFDFSLVFCFQVASGKFRFAVFDCSDFVLAIENQILLVGIFLLQAGVELQVMV